jgi:hypothetical protein
MPLWFFRREDRDRKKVLEVPQLGEGFYPLLAAVHLNSSARYIEMTNSPVT